MTREEFARRTGWPLAELESMPTAVLEDLLGLYGLPLLVRVRGHDVPVSAVREIMAAAAGLHSVVVSEELAAVLR